MKTKISNSTKFNVFNFLSTFARSLVEIFISLYLFKNGFNIQELLVFYILENLFAIFLSYIYVIIGEKYNYSIPILIGIVSFVGLQIMLINCVNSLGYIFIISLLYSIYRRGYWVSRRFYITNIMPKKLTSEPFSIILVVGQLGSIIAGYVGSILLDGFNMIYLTIISSILLIISVMPLICIKYKKSTNKIQLLKKLKEYDKRNILAFSLYELNNLLEYIFPIYIAVYIKNTYTMAGTVNAITSISIILFIILYGKLIKKKNYFVVSVIAFIIVNILKLFTATYIILVIYFFEGIIKKMQNQSVNKIYFENQNNMDITHYNLIYQIIEAVTRMTVAIPLLFINSLIAMILVVIGVITIELIVYIFMQKNKVLS